MSSPLFQTFARAARQQAMQQFRRTSLGKLLSATEDAYKVFETYQSVGKDPAAFIDKRIAGIGRDLEGRLNKLLTKANELAKPEGVVKELARLGLGREKSEMLEEAEKFARGEKSIPGAVRDELVKAVLENLTAKAGPIGDVIKQVLFQPRKRSRLGRELSTMTRVLQSLGFEVLHKPDDKHPPTPRELAAAMRTLQAAGYTVIPPKGKGEQPTVLVGDRRRGNPKMQVGDATVKAYGNRVEVEVGGTKVRVPKDDPLVTGEMIPVSSSNVHSIGYRIGEHDLLVRFLGHDSKGNRAGPGPMYVYHDVPVRIFQQFRRASSMGKFVWDHLRIRGTVSGRQFDYQLTEIQGNYVPRLATIGPEGEVYEPRTMIGRGKTLTSQLPREVIRPLSRTQYRKLVRGGVDLMDRQNGRQWRGRGRGSRDRSR